MCKNSFDAAFQAPEKVAVFPEGPCTQQLGTWDLGHSNCGTGFG